MWSCEEFVDDLTNDKSPGEQQYAVDHHVDDAVDVRNNEGIEHGSEGDIGQDTKQEVELSFFICTHV
jgi:hypothetical protein